MLKLNKDVAIMDLKRYGFGSNGAYQKMDEDGYPYYSLEVDFETKEVEFYGYGDFKADRALLNTLYVLIKDNVFVIAGEPEKEV